MPDEIDPNAPVTPPATTLNDELVTYEVVGPEGDVISTHVLPPTVRPPMPLGCTFRLAAPAPLAHGEPMKGAPAVYLPPADGSPGVLGVSTPATRAVARRPAPETPPSEG